MEAAGSINHSYFYEIYRAESHHCIKVFPESLSPYLSDDTDSKDLRNTSNLLHFDTVFYTAFHTMLDIKL